MASRRRDSKEPEVEEESASLPVVVLPAVQCLLCERFYHSPCGPKGYYRHPSAEKNGDAGAVECVLAGRKLRAAMEGPQSALTFSFVSEE